MGSEESKTIVRHYFDAIRTGTPPIPDLLSDDVTWWVPPSSRMGGLHKGKGAVLELMAGGIDLYDATVPLDVEIEGMIGEGDEVSARVVIEGRTAKGEDYRNHYHFAFRVRDGLICEVCEYVDTLYAERKLFGC